MLSPPNPMPEPSTERACGADTMSLRATPSAMRLRHHRSIGWVAILLMLFQVVLSADHMGATAARAFADPHEDVALGLLSLCHGDGSLAPLDGSPDQSTHPPAAPCILCTVAAAAANGVTSTPPALDPPQLHPLAETSLPSQTTAPVRSPLRYGTLRGPPTSIRV